MSPLAGGQPVGRYNPLLGEFLEASIPGLPFESAYILPAQAVRPGGEIIVIDEKNRIVRTAIAPVYADGEKVVVDARTSSLEPGALVCITPIAFPANGATVQPLIDGQPKSRSDEADKPRRKGGKN